MVLLLAGCGRSAERCPCEGVEGHGVLEGGHCLCLASLPATPDPEPGAVFWVDADAEVGDGSEDDPWGAPDWEALDASLSAGHVEVRFDGADAWPERLVVRRTDAGPHRLTLRGRGWVRGEGGWVEQTVVRARVPGILTPYEDVPRHRVTVRGFEVTGSRDKGIHWQAGDDVLIEDNVVHANGGSPSISLTYSSRTGLPSAGFTVRNNHVFDQMGECIYIGGSEGVDEDSHALVVIEGNLVHDCRNPFSTKHDGINVKDRIGEVRVERNVVLRADWGIEVGSPGRYAHNLVVDADREGFQVNDAFAPVRDMVFADNVVLGAGHDGWHVAPSTGPAQGLVVERLTVVGAGGAGILVGGELRAEVSVEDVVLVGNEAALAGWGRPDGLSVGTCAVGAEDLVDEGAFAGLAACETVDAPDVSDLAGPDRRFFTEDDPWLVEGRGARLPP